MLVILIHTLCIKHHLYTVIFIPFNSFLSFFLSITSVDPNKTPSVSGLLWAWYICRIQQVHQAIKTPNTKHHLSRNVQHIIVSVPFMNTLPSHLCQITTQSNETRKSKPFSLAFSLLLQNTPAGNQLTLQPKAKRTIKILEHPVQCQRYSEAK